MRITSDLRSPPHSALLIKKDQIFQKKQQQFWDALTYPPNFHSTLQIKAKLALA